MLMFTIQCRSHCLLLAALIFIGTRGAAQSAADQSFKTIPQQIKTSAEIKATNKANSVANGATDKVDSGVNKAYRGLMKMFKKKPKPGTGPKDSTGRPVDSLSGAPKVSWIPGRKEGWAVGDGVEDLVACILKTA